MTGATRVGDLTTGHTIGPCVYASVSCPSASPDVTINGMAAVRVGDQFNPHGGGACGVHQGSVQIGSSTVLINGMAAARIGDLLTDGDTVSQGSPDVIIGG